MDRILHNLSSKSSLILYFSFFFSISFVFYVFFLISHGWTFMDYLERIERNIKKDFPDITEAEFLERMELIKHLIAMKHYKNESVSKGTSPNVE